VSWFTGLFWGQAPITAVTERRDMPICPLLDLKSFLAKTGFVARFAALSISHAHASGLLQSSTDPQRSGGQGDGDDRAGNGDNRFPRNPLWRKHSGSQRDLNARDRKPCAF